ncbi:MAG: hypothetical protein OQJ97_12365 [Rhodospirillales bacterium]|nr:hypothetical protein [Rhodospirillales bacterium]
MVETPSQDGFFFQFDEPERVKSIKDNLLYKKYFTENASLPDLKPEKLGIYLLGFARNKVDAFALGVKTGTTATQSVRIKLKQVTQFAQIDLDDILPNTQVGQLTKSQILKQNKIRLGSGVLKAAIDRLIILRPEIEHKLNKLIQITNGISFDDHPDKARLFALQRDALQSAAKAFGLKTIGYEDLWEPDEYEESLTYNDGIFVPDEIHLTEDDILIHDQKYFDKFALIDEYHFKTNVFSDGNREILVTMANRNELERVLGVDLIFYNEEIESFCLVQYKRMSKTKSNRFVYYPNSDKNYKSDIRKMKEFTRELAIIEREEIGRNLNSTYSNFKAFSSPFFFKFCKSIQFAPFENNVIQGQYLSYDLWASYARECKETGQTLKASQDVLRKHLSEKTFNDFLKNGLIGSRRASSDTITSIISDCLRADRAVVFTRKPRP